MSFKQKKRFIAGAVCPRCSEMDKLVIYRENDKDYRECVSCGYKEEMRFNQSKQELETRVNVTKAQKQSETQVLQFVSPDKNKK